MFFELCEGRAGAQNTYQQIIKQFSVLLLVAGILATSFVMRCDGGVAKVTSSLDTPAAIIKTPKISSTQTSATTPIYPAARQDRSQLYWGNTTIDPTIIAGFLGAGGFILGASIGASATLIAALVGIPTALIGGSAIVIAALIGITPGLLALLLPILGL